MDTSISASWDRGKELVTQFWPDFPAILLVPLVWRFWEGRKRQFEINLTFAGLALVVISPVLLPNSGGKQIGLRYLLVLVPVAALALATLWTSVRAELLHEPRRRIRRAVSWAVQFLILISVAYGGFVNIAVGTKAVARDYSYRIRPALEFLKNRPEKIIVFTHQWSSQELTALIPDRVFFRVQGLDSRRWSDEDPNSSPFDGFVRLTRALHEAGLQRFVLVALNGQAIPADEFLGTERVHFQPLRHLGQFDLYEGEVIPMISLAPRS